MSELAKINACAKRPIDVWTNYIYYPLSIRLVYLIRNTRIKPNEITLFSMFLCLIGCVGFAVGLRPYVVAGLVFVQVSYVFDCADGQLARYKQQFSPVGGWLDQVSDRIKEFAIYFSLAYGYTRFHDRDLTVWKWAVIALFSLYLLEYYGQIHFKPRAVAATPDGALASSTAPETGRMTGFGRAQRLRSFVPFRGFIIGEQYFAMLVFVACHAIVPLFRFVGIVGLLMCVYRPAVQYYKWSRGYQ
ncbi:CDP-alcohol phosphatidyltransferase [Alicyclobacillus tengchongensis]|nr:CDP-alcohol phosphatidyltransferase [Alicyclobacillus tengchongensis]